MSNLTKHAKKELELVGLFDVDSDYGGALAENVMELIEVFSKQGHSGCSASMAVDLFSKLASYKTLSPLTGKDDEWTEITDGLFQNKRNSAVFKNKGSDKAHYIDAIVWKTQKGGTWNGSADGIRSCQYIKSFPFQPKTFIIDVIEEEVKKDDLEFHITNKEDLAKVWEVYDEYKTEQNEI